MQCKYSEFIKKSVFEQYLNCSLTHSFCSKQKFCHKENKPINTEDWQLCPMLGREEGKHEGNKKEK